MIHLTFIRFHRVTIQALHVVNTSLNHNASVLMEHGVSQRHVMLDL